MLKKLNGSLIIHIRQVLVLVDEQFDLILEQENVLHTHGIVLLR